MQRERQRGWFPRRCVVEMYDGDDDDNDVNESIEDLQPNGECDKPKCE